MRVFQRTGKDGRTSATWYVELRDHNGIDRRLAGYRDKGQTHELAKQLRRLVLTCEHSERPDQSLTLWLKTLRPRMKARLLAWKLLDPHRHAEARPLLEHVAEFAESLTPSGNTPEYVRLTRYRVERIVKGCGFVRWSDIAASKVQRFLGELRKDRPKKRGLSAQAFNYYLATSKGFAAWMVRDGRATESPVAHLKGMNARTDRRHERGR